MDPNDQLLTFAEISIALAGFAGIVATFQSRQQGGITPGRVLDLWMIVNISLAGAFASALPLVMQNFGMQEPNVWAVCSGLMAVNQSVFTYFLFRRTRLRYVAFFTRLLYLFLYLVSLGFILINILNAAGLVFTREFGPYFVTIIFNFVIVGMSFSRLLMRPLWKTIQEEKRTHE